MKKAKKEKKKILKLRNCHIVTQESFVTREKLDFVLKSVDKISSYAYILHDKDRYSPKEKEKNLIPEGKDVGELKIPHYHIVLRLNNLYTPNLIASWFGIPSNFVEKIKVSLSFTLQYLTHLNEEEHKYQHLYDDSEVVSNFAWIPLRDMQRIWNLEELDFFRNRIISGEVKKFNLDKYVSPANFDKYKDKINNAFEYYEMKLMNSNQKKDINIVYIYGRSGVMKTRLAESLIKKQGFSNNKYKANGSGDIFGKYGGQEVVLIDDFRPIDSTLKLPDILTIFDNTGQYRFVKSRYRDKVLECSWIYITTTLTVQEFFQQMISKYGDECGKYESSLQLRRRIKHLIYVDEKEIQFRVWLHNSKKFSDPCYKPNTLFQEYEFDSVDPNGREVLDVLHSDFKDLDINRLLSEEEQKKEMIKLAKEFFGEEKVTVLNGNISDNDF